MSDIQWEDPPTPKRPYHRHAALAAKLRSRPGKWARIAQYPTLLSARRTAYLVRTGAMRAYEPAGYFDASARHVDGESWLYARYVGDGDE